MTTSFDIMRFPSKIRVSLFEVKKLNLFCNIRCLFKLRLKFYLSLKCSVCLCLCVCVCACACVRVCFSEWVRERERCICTKALCCTFLQSGRCCHFLYQFLFCSVLFKWCGTTSRTLLCLSWTQSPHGLTYWLHNHS